MFFCKNTQLLDLLYSSFLLENNNNNNEVQFKCKPYKKKKVNSTKFVVE